MHHRTGLPPNIVHLVVSILILLPAGVWLSGCSGCGRTSNQNSGTAEITGRDTSVQNRGLAPESELAYIGQYLGRRPAEVNLWESEPLHTKLEKMLGKDYRMYLESMKQAGPLTRDGVIYTIGVGSEDIIPRIAYLLIDTVNDHLKAYAVYGDLVIEAETPGSTWIIPEEVKRQLTEVLNI